MTKKTIVFVGPSAVGKTFIADKLIKQYPSEFEQAKIHTTRQARPGEKPVDRIFISSKEFDTMVKQNKFLVYSEFGGNNYGFSRECLYPRDKHILVNAWPWLAEQLSLLSHVILIGMQAPSEWTSLMMKRMVNRGDSTNTIKARLKLIEKDYKDLELYRDYIESSGKFFVIKNDETIHDEIMPWIIEKLKLK